MTLKPQGWDEKRVKELVDAAKEVDRPRSKRPRKKSECKQHEFIESDRCHWCGAPDPAQEAVKKFVEEA